MKQACFMFLLLFWLESNCQLPDTSNIMEVINMRDAGFGKVDGKSLIPFTATLLDGKVITNKDIAAKATFLNLWFATCQPCIKEIPKLNNLYDTFKDSVGFKFYSITYETKDEAIKFIKNYGIRFPVLLVSYDIAKKLNLGRGYPTNFLLTSQGKIYSTYGGLYYPENVVEDYFIPSIKKLLSINTSKIRDSLDDQVNRKSDIVFIDSVIKIKSINQLATYFKNKSLYVDLWATWCLPCRNEFVIKNSVDSFLTKNKIDRVFISVDNQKNTETWKSLVYNYGLRGYHLLADKELIKDIKQKIYKKMPTEIPRYIIVKNGKIVESNAFRPSNNQKLIKQLSEKLL